jgi:hypothetical protein
MSFKYYNYKLYVDTYDSGTFQCRVSSLRRGTTLPRCDFDDSIVAKASIMYHVQSWFNVYSYQCEPRGFPDCPPEYGRNHLS